MQPQFDHYAINSFYFWFDYTLLSAGQAFENSSLLELDLNTNPPNRIAGYDYYQSPHSQWVYDNQSANMTGAYVPSGVYLNGTFTGRGDDLFLDYQDGGIYINNSIPVISISGQYAKKTFNVYYNDAKEEEILFMNNFENRNKLAQQRIPLTGQKTYPAVFLKYNVGSNEGFCFGGEQKTTMKARAIVLADNEYHYQGIMSIFRDQSDKVFPIFNGYDKFPFNLYGELKSGEYNYLNNFAYVSNNDPRNLADIKRVRISNFPEEANQVVGPDVRGGFIDFDIDAYRLTISRPAVAI